MATNPRCRHLVRYRFWPIVFAIFNRFIRMSTFWECIEMMYEILLS
jgi:hypothetical protein